MHQIRIGFIRAYEKSSQNHPFTRVLFTYVNQFIRIIQFFLKIYFYTACECGEYTHDIF
jgi:hypothetical protein